MEEQALSAYAAVLRVLEGSTARQNRRDDQRVRVLAAAVLRADSNCVDIGANEGVLLAIFAELAPRGRHIAYEPVSGISARLAERFPDVEIRCAAVSDHVGEAQFVVNRRLPSRSGLLAVGNRPKDTEKVRVPVESLDSSLPAGYVPRLIKIDVEGAEHLVLRGGLESIREHRPLIIFEHQRSTAMHYGTAPSDVFGLLVDELGMRIFDLEGGGPYSLSRFEQAYESGSHWNFLAAPA
jgi:FkbM family methyltransferase